jgi:hypothetical protein
MPGYSCHPESRVRLGSKFLPFKHCPLARWSSGIIFDFGDMGREIESRLGIGKVVPRYVKTFFSIFISRTYTMIMHIKFRQQHCNILRPENLTPWRDSNPGSYLSYATF